jgi:hypothetical protein
LRLEEALAKAQIEPKLLKKNNARVTAMQMELISGIAMQELDDEGLGWFSRRLPWGSYGMLVRASLTSPTLGVALNRWCRHHGLLTDDIHLSLTERNGIATLQLDEMKDLGVFREFCVVSVLRNALGVACWLTDSRIPLMATHLRFAPPAHRDSYRVLFDGPTTFEASKNALQFDAGYLDLPVRRDEAALQQMLQRALLLTVRPKRCGKPWPNIPNTAAMPMTWPHGSTCQSERCTANFKKKAPACNNSKTACESNVPAYCYYAPQNP